ncbi:molybdopterin-dependent oxidoreductase [Hymenobacter terricola]|uniref:molybdopterin-dependent oxidoreductase n=1 Tax=Hymenobacter terricola TaxID=2819236 RepID=UPI001B314939|nr:molybdopterin-dependent oxidoreductase [Hymenobacter terricola]
MPPDEEYHVGLEIESALHPQTLLCYEMNGEPLILEHGAPPRRGSPFKYGVKHIKRINDAPIREDEWRWR